MSVFKSYARASLFSFGLLGASLRRLCDAFATTTPYTLMRVDGKAPGAETRARVASSRVESRRVASREISFGRHTLGHSHSHSDVQQLRVETTNAPNYSLSYCLVPHRQFDTLLGRWRWQRRSDATSSCQWHQVHYLHVSPLCDKKVRNFSLKVFQFLPRTALPCTALMKRVVKLVIFFLLKETRVTLASSQQWRYLVTSWTRIKRSKLYTRPPSVRSFVRLRGLIEKKKIRISTN